MVLERRAARDPGGRARPVRRRVLPRASQRRHGRLFGRLVHAARDLRALARAARCLRRGARCRVGWAWAYGIGCRRDRCRLGPAPRPPAFAISAPSARSLPTPISTGPASSGLACSMRRQAGGGARGLTRRDRDDAPRRPRSCRGWPEHGVTVEVDGRAGRLPRRRRLAGIGVSTAEIVGERDWFDLGVTISVEGRELPFAEVFVALASGESRMLLDDGAHFSLLAPPPAVAAPADRGGTGARRLPRRRRCGSAATRPGCGRSSPRSAS